MNKRNIEKIIACSITLTVLTGSNALAIGKSTIDKNVKKPVKVVTKTNTKAKKVNTAKGSIDHLYSPEELKEDLDYMIKTLEEVHPNLYYAVDKVTVKKEFEKVKNSFTKPMSSIEFYKKIAPIIAKFNDGHTCLRVPYKDIELHFEKGEKLFPYAVNIQDGKLMIVDGLGKKSSIPSSSEIISINGIPAKKIINDCIIYISGERVNFREKILQGSFAYMFWLLYGDCTNCDIKYKVNDTDKVIKSAKVSGVSYKECIDYKKNKQVSSNKNSNKSNQDYEYSYIKDINTGLIDFRSFNNLDAFGEFLKSTFKDMNEKKTENLIIDIRNNGGGNSTLGDLLACYITDKDFTTFSKVEQKVSKQIIAYEKECFDKTNTDKNNSFVVSNDGNSAKITYGDYVENYKAGEKVIYNCDVKRSFSIPRQFNGNVYLLTSPKTFSSATDFASVIKDFNLGTIIGEETGGLATCYGDVYSFSLKNLKLNLGVSYKYFVRPSGKDDGRGVIPDHEVYQNTEDSKKGVDTVMEYTKKLIIESQKK